MGLFNFSESRLPFPLTAVYGEMCAVARRATGVCELSTRMASFVIGAIGTPGSTSLALEAVLRRPQHVLWHLDVRQSGFKSLEKMWRHFHSKRLLEAHQQRWYKS